MPKLTMNGTDLRELLLDLGEGQRVLVGTEEWLALGQADFEVLDLGNVLSEPVHVDDVWSELMDGMDYEVVVGGPVARLNRDGPGILKVVVEVA